MKNSEEIIEAIKKIRKKRNIRQDEMAEAIGVTTAQYSHYETGRTEMGLNTLFKILNYFDISIEELIELENNKISKHDIENIIITLEKLKDKM